MRYLTRAFLALCMLLVVAVASLDVESRPRGELVFHWTCTTFQQAYRLRGRYQIWGLSNGMFATLQSPSDATDETRMPLDPGLYGIQLEPGACVEFQPSAQGPTPPADAAARERCTTAALAPTLVIVEAGGHMHIALSVRQPVPDQDLMP